MDIIDKIFYLIKENNITAKHLAEHIGVSTGNVSEWKKRRARPNIDVVVKIAQYFDVTTDYLLGMDEE